jgi:putative DNA-invertase from lambdoid prophage Rac
VIYAYARTSTIKQAGPDKTTIEEQLAKCKAVAGLRGSVGKYDFQPFTDAGVSGSIPLSERPSGKELLTQVKPGDIIIAAKLDRMFRSAADACVMIERFKKQKIGLILIDLGTEPVAESAIANVVFTVMSAFAQLERERIRERVIEGKRAKAAKGGLAGGPVPLGFSKIGEGPKAILVRNEAEAEHIRAARYHARNVKLRRRRGAFAPSALISRLLAEEGMLGRDGKPYHRATIWKMIRTRVSAEVTA